MRVTFEVTEDKGELVAVHDGTLGLLVAFGSDWETLKVMINETVASAIDNSGEEIEIELFIDEYHVARFKYSYSDDEPKE